MVLQECMVKSKAGTLPKIQVNLHDLERFAKYTLLTISHDLVIQRILVGIGTAGHSCHPY